MSPYYNQNYTRYEVEEILFQIKECVRNDRFTISRNENRQENVDFINEYNIRSDRQKKILIQLQADDFCHSLPNRKVGYRQEVLYVFVPQVRLCNVDGEIETIDIYTKFNVILMSGSLPASHRMVVVSFHKRNKPVNYLFR